MLSVAYGVKSHLQGHTIVLCYAMMYSEKSSRRTSVTLHYFKYDEIDIHY